MTGYNYYYNFKNPIRHFIDIDSLIYPTSPETLDVKDIAWTKPFKFQVRKDDNRFRSLKIPNILIFAASYENFKSLYLTKTGMDSNYDVSKLDIKKIALLFEDGSIYDDYSKMIDYGISNDLIVKLHDNQISIEKIKKREYSENVFDAYELLLLEEFSTII